MIEMYDDRIEVSNPGTPAIPPTRFIDEYRSRNERLADVMRRLGICEEKGSGIDKVVSAAEVFQLQQPTTLSDSFKPLKSLASSRDGLCVDANAHTHR